MRSARLAWLELQRFRGPRLQWVPALLVVVPLLTATLAMVPLWNPEGRLNRVPAAIVNMDTPAQLELNGTGSKTLIQAGDDLTKELKASRSFSWRNLSHGQAIQQLRKGDVYFALVIPRDFSSNITASLTQDEIRPAQLTLELNDANGYLIGVTAERELETVQEEATAAALGYATRGTADVWGGLRSTIDKIINSSGALTGKPDQPTNGPAPPEKRGFALIASQLTEATASISQVNDVVQAANANSGKMAFQLNDAAAAAQSTQDIAGSGNPTLLQQSASQTTTSVRVAQDGVSSLSSQLQSATSTTKGVLDKVTRLSENAGFLSAAVSGLEKELDTLAKTIPPADAKQRKDDSEELVSLKTHNLHPARVLGRGVLPLVFSMTTWATVLCVLSVLRPINSRALASPVNAFTIVRTGWIPMATISFLVTCGLFAVYQAVAKVNAVHGWAVLCACLITASAFAALGQLLKVVFGAAGEAMLLLLLALQFGSSGGLFPVETTNSLFVNVQPFLPMTYSIEAFRMTISGGEASQLWRSSLILLGTTIVSLVVTTLCLGRRRQWTSDRLTPQIHERCT